MHWQGWTWNIVTASFQRSYRWKCTGSSGQRSECSFSTRFSCVFEGDLYCGIEYNDFFSHVFVENDSSRVRINNSFISFLWHFAEVKIWDEVALRLCSRDVSDYCVRYSLKIRDQMRFSFDSSDLFKFDSTRYNLRSRATDICFESNNNSWSLSPMIIYHYFIYQRCKRVIPLFQTSLVLRIVNIAQTKSAAKQKPRSQTARAWSVPENVGRKWIRSPKYLFERCFAPWF